MKWAGHVALVGENNVRVYRILIGKPEGNEPVGRPKRKWVDSIKIDLR
jgi:hypothetical protein